MSVALLVFPNQLFENHPGFQQDPQKVYLSEDPLFFGDEQYPMAFHRQKIGLHRASMRQWFDKVTERCDAQYFDYVGGGSVLKEVVQQMLADGVTTVVAAEVVDFILEKRLRRETDRAGLELKFLPTPLFINSAEQNDEYRAGKKRWFMADFYRWQRTRLNILVENGEPVGGQWSFDEDNRKKLPKSFLPELPELPSFPPDDYRKEAREYVEQHFGDRPGECGPSPYPINSAEAKQWFEDFLTHRFSKFGPYEDAIEEGENTLYHSLLTPALNIGLITPAYVVERALAFAEEHDTPIASVEGFIRQVIGWREFMRATYDDLGVTMRSTNAWKHTRPMPASFYTGETDIHPIDDTIRRVLRTGYCHHIERLMVLGGFMFLCEIDPDAIYQWFMEMFIDSYDWVMVTNVYAMSQNADGGNITTKPYFSGSNYVLKMSHYKKEAWSGVWDSLYWSWILTHADQLRKNPRWAMMVRMAEKMSGDKKQGYYQQAEAFLAKLDDSSMHSSARLP
ncbi:cryptochrome/photolyase family protein [Verrucomicrobiaceae bacterium R5-34]|nr:cryptochrome/photolyase family protein [Verrucomicrobiaceae bacterium R5-34]